MAERDWFKNDSWDDHIRKEFFTHLGRARKDNRAQYLRIQAVHLQQSRPDVAEELLLFMIANYPDDVQLASAHFQRAEIANAKGDLPKALECLRAVFSQQRRFPHAFTDAHLTFGKLVVENALVGLYDEAETLLAEFGEHKAFPAQFYWHFGTLAVIVAARGDRKTASQLAAKALEYTALKEGWLRYHKTLGLVEDTSTKFHRGLLELAKT